MNYTYTMTGGLVISGCGSVTFKKFIYFRYGPGSNVYLRYKASEGVLEIVTIKKIVPVSNYKTGYRLIPFYIDNLNGTYNESDLCSETDAVALATAFYESQLSQINDLMRRCPNGG